MRRRGKPDFDDRLTAVETCLHRLRREELRDDEAVHLIADTAGPDFFESMEEDAANDKDGEAEDDSDASEPFHFGSGPLEDHLHSLMRAALYGDPIAVLTEEQRLVARRERALRSAPLVEAFGVVAELEPRMRDLAVEVESGVWASAVLPDLIEDPAHPDSVYLPRVLSRRVRAQIQTSIDEIDRFIMFLRARLTPLVGPLALDPSDELLRTSTAEDLAREYLHDLRTSKEGNNGTRPKQQRPIRHLWNTIKEGRANRRSP